MSVPAAPIDTVPAAMPWVEIFAVFVVSHLVGDFLLQTDLQAMRKRGGLGGGESWLGLISHTLTYTIAFVPALVWIADGLGAWKALCAAALIAIPHMLQDDGRLLDAYMRRVKRVEPQVGSVLLLAVDQSFHLLALFLLALIVGT